MSQPVTLLSLANEIILEIPGQLEQPYDVNSLLKVNRRFANLLTPLFNKLVPSDKDGMPALHWVASKSYERLARLLIKKGADVNSMTNHLELYYTALHWAVDSGSESIVKLLLENGAAVDGRHFQRNSSFLNETLLLRAVVKGSATIVRMLLDSGANTKLWGGRTAIDVLYRAVSHGMAKSTPGENLEIISTLLEYGVVGKSYGCGGRHEVLHYAVVARNPSERILRLLVENAADINIKTWSGQTPLLLAAQYRKSFAIGLLLEHGADVFAVQNEGFNALHWTMQYHTMRIPPSPAIVKQLLDAEIDLATLNHLGQTALDLAI